MAAHCTAADGLVQRLQDHGLGPSADPFHRAASGPDAIGTVLEQSRYGGTSLASPWSFHPFALSSSGHPHPGPLKLTYAESILDCLSEAELEAIASCIDNCYLGWTRFARKEPCKDSAEPELALCPDKLQHAEHEPQCS